MLQVEFELLDFVFTDRAEVFGQLPYDVYDVLEALIWFALLSSFKPDSNLQLKLKEKNFGDLRGKLVL